MFGTQSTQYIRLSKGFQTIEDAEPELVSSNGAENWYESTLWVMKTIFDMPIDIDSYLLVHPAQNTSAFVHNMLHFFCTAYCIHIRYYFELDGRAHMHGYRI